MDRPACDGGRATLRTARRGFTLIEAAIVTSIVGFAVIATLQLLAAGSMANSESAQLTTAIHLAAGISERVQASDYDSLHADWDNRTCSPPIDARGVQVTGIGDWSQVVDVKYVLPNDINFAVPDTQIEDTSRVTVQILHNGVEVYTSSWIMAAPH